MPTFNQSGYGSSEAGSKYVTPGTLRLAGLSAIACIVFLVHAHRVPVASHGSSAIVCSLAGVHTAVVPLASAGSSSTTLSVCRIYRRGLESTGSSSMATNAMKAQPPWAGGGGYGLNEYGSPYLTAGTLGASGSSS